MLLKTSRLPAFSDSLGSGSGGESMRGLAGLFDVDERLKRVSDRRSIAGFHGGG
jgi:hypothetical protein